MWPMIITDRLVHVSLMSSIRLLLGHASRLGMVRRVLLPMVARCGIAEVPLIGLNETLL